MSLPTEAPHKIVGQILDGVINSAEGVGDAIIQPLDKLPLGPNGPQAAVNDVLDGLSNGIQTVGNGISDALSSPLQAINLK